jgi:hypothetical protein
MSAFGMMKEGEAWAEEDGQIKLESNGFWIREVKC